LQQENGDDSLDKGNNPDIKKQSVEFLYAGTNQKIISLPQSSLDKFINVVTLNLINVNLNTISYRHFKNLIQLKYLDLSCNKLRKLPRKLFKENENLSDVTFTNNQVSDSSLSIIFPFFSFRLKCERKLVKLLKFTLNLL
jgi:Leucine-rich repeat (LRR) protein